MVSPVNWVPLVPFSKEHAKLFDVSGTIVRSGLCLHAHFRVSGDLQRITLPRRNSPRPCRMGGLWETTCFELFLKNKHFHDYIEFNFAPSGNWNSFYFTDYRAGMSEFGGIEKIDIIFSKSQETYELEAIVHQKEKRRFELGDYDLGNIKAGLSAVIEIAPPPKTPATDASSEGRQLSYWALKHFGKKPDFHVDDNFSLTL